jgi:HAE1 family hydrophobic/amphiphilic exporter-1
MAHRWSVLAAAALASAVAVPLFRMLPTELAPQADEGRFLVAIRTPLGSSIHYTESKLREVEEIVFRYPDVVTEFGVIGLQYAATFYASPAIPLAAAIEKVREAGKSLPPGHTLAFIGEAEQLEKTRQAIAFTFGLALVLLFMVLASQFNSFLQPLFIMLAVPLAIIGGVLALWLFVPLHQLGQAIGLRIPLHTLNIYSMIGLVLLIGLVAKNSILLVDLTNQRRAGGMAVDAALLNACPIRMRPVLMTSLTIILALTPAALGLGAGAETNAPLAVAVIGGMITSTLLTLVVVPAAYSLVENWRTRRHARRAGGAAAPDSPQAPKKH